MKAETATAAAAAAGGFSLVAGTIFGVPTAAIVGGFVGGLFAMSAMPPGTAPMQRFWTLVLSTLAGSFFGPVAGPVGASILPDAAIQTVSPQLIIASGGIVSGFGAQSLLGAVLRRGIRQIGGDDKSGGGNGNG